jgi:50S ribosomal subunit-associated GTPase HflX
MIVVATKLDATTDRTRLAALRAYCQGHGLEFHALSAATGEGVKQLVRSIADALEKIPRASLAHASSDERFADAVPVDPSARQAAENGNS